MKKKNKTGQFIDNGEAKYHKGYKVVYMPDHPHARQNGYVYEHILVIEEKLGRQLKECEVVHHIDGNKLNNNADNLMLFNNNTEHLKHHWKEKRHRYTLKDGRVVTIDELATLSNISYMTAYQRLIKLGWSADDVLVGEKTVCIKQGGC